MSDKYTNYPNGVTSMGVPQIGSSMRDVGVPFKDGFYWFVDQNTGVDGNSGKNTDDAFATIGYALLVAEEGDTIVVAPGTYREGLTVTTDFITIVGWSPSGAARPTIATVNPSLGGFAMNVHAQGFTCKHVVFSGNGIGGIGLQQMGGGFLYEDCWFTSDSNIGFRLFPDSSDSTFSASDGEIHSCLIAECAGGGMSFENPGGSTNVGISNVIVSGCRFFGNTGADIFDVQSGSTPTLVNCIITGCQFESKNSTTYIDLDAATGNTGLISNNYFAFSTAGGLTATQIALNGECVFSGNWDAHGFVDGHTF